MYVMNAWYVAAWSKEIGRALTPRIILDIPVVLFRREDGTVAALEDRCAHRHVPLSNGLLVGDLVECSYHGLRYDCSGACVAIPAQDRIPERARVRAFPLVERYGWAWIWLGDPGLADPASIPDFHRLGDPAYAATGTTNYVRANYELVTDNLLDLSHVGFVHGTTIGNNEMGNKGKITAERTDKGVRVTRWVIDCAPPPTYCKTGIMSPDDRIDRWQVIDFEPPCFVMIYAGGAPTGTGAPEGRRVGGLGTWITNAMTPETPSSTHYYWAIGRDFHVGNPAVTELLHREITAAFEQDKTILQLQQAAIDRFADPPNVDIVADTGGIQARRIVRQRIAAEREPARAEA